MTTQSDDWISFDFGGSADKIETVPNFVVSASDDPLFFRFLASKSIFVFSSGIDQ